VVNIQGRKVATGARPRHLAAEQTARNEGMPRRRRPVLITEAERRWRERRARLGGDIRAARVRRKWTQAELARRAGVGRSAIGRAERGTGSLDLEALERIAVALSVPLVIAFGRDPRDEIADAGHLAMQEFVIGLARRAGFTTAFELPTRPSEPWRSTDVALGDPARRVLIDAECWNTFGDVGASTRSSSRKLAELDQIAVGRWGPDARAATVWVVRSTARNHALIARYPEVFATRFTGSSTAWVRALAEGGEVPTEPGLVWCDLATDRLHAWRRPTVSEKAPGRADRQQS
jgi:transcriptional regulator with XRE-family HTH domain